MESKFYRNPAKITKKEKEIPVITAFLLIDDTNRRYVNLVISGQHARRIWEERKVERQDGLESVRSPHWFGGPFSQRECIRRHRENTERETNRHTVPDTNRNGGRRGV